MSAELKSCDFFLYQSNTKQLLHFLTSNHVIKIRQTYMYKYMKLQESLEQFIFTTARLVTS